MRENGGGWLPLLAGAYRLGKMFHAMDPFDGLSWRFIYLYFFFSLEGENFGERGFVGYRRVFGVIEDRVELGKDLINRTDHFLFLIISYNWMNIGAYESKVLNGCLEIVKLIYAL